jgi:hypothetical protein
MVPGNRRERVPGALIASLPESRLRREVSTKKGHSMRLLCMLRTSSLSAISAFFLVLLCSAAQAACADDGGPFPKKCTKEIRIWNNTPRKIYIVMQAGIQLHDALNCTVAAKGGGDVWLQAALGDSSSCHAVNNDYYVYINPDTGIPPNGFVSINVPWWSKRQPSAPDLYIDWWRGGRLFIFDDKTALNDSYLQMKGKAKYLVQFATGSPQVACNKTKDNKCKQSELQTYQVPPRFLIAQYTPFQLTEFTFADVAPVTNNGQAGGQLLDFNQNYNVSNVDQLYLPIAIEPVREPADVPYMGTTMSVNDFRKALKRFVGRDASKWPVYNNPVQKSTHKPLYPTAGVRVPSAAQAFNYYMNPLAKLPSGEPLMIPKNPPEALQKMISQWQDCTRGSAPCPDKKIYQEINTVFLQNYGDYISQCTPPNYLAPKSGSNPPQPKKLTALLTYVHGWAPFDAGCSSAPQELPTIQGGSRAPIDYVYLQYNYLNRPKARWFNPYTRLVHGPTAEGGLAANAYAFSIDDRASYQNNSGGSLSGGLIVAVGGENGLVNKTQMPPPIPEYYPNFFFGLQLGAPSAGGARWAKYGICSNNADTPFPPSTNGAYAIGVDPALYKISAGNPCKMTLMDTKNRTYQIVVLQAQIPPKAIWPHFPRTDDPGPFDKSVVSCPNKAGLVPPAKWCKYTNETAKPQNMGGPEYTLSVRGPLP